jgi:membrane protease subunit (stomatin/prohibitin family)
MIAKAIKNITFKPLRLISCPDMGAGSLTLRFDDGDRAIERGARLLVSEGQVAQFVYMGKYGDLFAPGEYYLHTDNIPVITALKSWKYGFESPFKADVYFVATKLFSGCKWGTTHPVMVHDTRLGVVRLRAYGSYDFKITNVPLFLSQVAGTDHNFTLAEFEETMKTRVASAFSQALALSGLEASLISTKYHELGGAFLPAFNNTISGLYGVELASLTVEAVSLPESVEQILDSGASIRALGGDMQSYMQVQLARGLGSGGGALSAAAEMALGLGAARMLENSKISSNGERGDAVEGVIISTPERLPERRMTLLEERGEPLTCTIADAAQKFGIPSEILEGAVKDGKLKSYDFLGHRVLKVADLEDLVLPEN